MKRFKTLRSDILGAFLIYGAVSIIFALCGAYAQTGGEPPGVPEQQATPPALAVSSAAPAMPPTALAEKLKLKISLDYKDADILTIMRSLSWSYGINIITSPDIKGKTTITLNDITLDEALDAISSSTGLSFTIKGEIIYVSKGDAETAELVNEVMFLKYLRAADAQNLLRKALSAKGDMKINEAGNSIVVSDYTANIQKVRKLLDKVDIAPQQVLIEAKIVDITSSDLDAIGVTWNIEYAPGKGIFGRSNSNPEEVDLSMSLAEQSSDLTGGQFTLNALTVQGVNITATIDALRKDGKAELLASPSIAVLNGEEARIIIGERYPYKERTQTTTGTTETTKFVDIGTTLRVTPQINEDGYITMRVHPEVSSFSQALDAGPRVTTREADTVVRIKEGETLIIGGLIKHDDASSAEKIPLLGDIPLIGNAFRRREKEIEQKELAVFITPRILYSREEREALSKKEVEQDEAYVSLTKTGELTVVERLFVKARMLNGGYGVESIRKDVEFRKAQAYNIFQHIYTEFPGSLRAPESMYRAAMIQLQHYEDYGKAKEIFARLISDYPRDSFAAEAKEQYKKIERAEGREKRRKEVEAKREARRKKQEAKQ